MTDLSPLLAQLQNEEGLRLQVYDDATGGYIRPGTRVIGNPTLGIGINVGPSGGITRDEAMYLLTNRVNIAAQEAATLSGWAALDDVRRLVLIDMVFNMGLPTMQTFHGTLAAIVAQDWATAAAQMLDSAWAREVGARATQLASIMKSGVWA